MAVEVERKFLVDRAALPELSNGQKIVQGYIPTADKTTVRVRVKAEQAFLTLKGISNGVSRSEFEYEIPLKDAQQMLDEFCCDSKIEKIRYEISHGQHVWELDIFQGKNDGLIIAEIELSDEDEAFERPNWVAEQVTGDKRYYNSQLIASPFSEWNL